MKRDRNPFRTLRREPALKPAVADSYRPEAKLADPTLCKECGATFRNGRWTWQKAPTGAHVHRCPACQRIHDRFPAGFVVLKAKFDAARRAQLLDLIAAREAREKAEHPMQRIIAIEDVAGAIQVTTTDTHLASAIAHAVRDAFHGTLEIAYSRDEALVRAVWRPAAAQGT